METIRHEEFFQEPVPPVPEIPRYDDPSILRTKHIYYWQPVKYEGYDFKCVQVKRPKKCWWVLVDDAEKFTAFFRDQNVTNPAECFKRLVVFHSKAVPWPLVVKLEEAKVECHKHWSRRNFPRILPLTLFMQVAQIHREKPEGKINVETVVNLNPKAKEPEEAPVADTDLKAENRRTVYCLEAWNFRGKDPEKEEQKWYRPPKLMRPKLERQGGSYRMKEWSLEELKKKGMFQASWSPVCRKGKRMPGYMRHNGEACYPCLVAGRRCSNRRQHQTQLWSGTCNACWKFGLSFQQCAASLPVKDVPTEKKALEKYLKKQKKEQEESCVPKSFYSWLHRQRERRMTQDCLACHICGNIGPFPNIVECMSCHIWVCGTESCRKMARVQEKLDRWYCCHCLGIPLQCVCELASEEVQQIIMRVEMLKPCRRVERYESLPKTPKRLRLWRLRLQPTTWTQPTMERDKSFIDDAAGHRPITPAEWLQLRFQLKKLRLLVKKHPEKQEEICFRWLRKQQQLGTPDMAISQLISIHKNFERRLVAKHEKNLENRHSKELYWKTRIPTFLEAVTAGWRPPTKSFTWIAGRTRIVFAKRLKAFEKYRKLKFIQCKTIEDEPEEETPWDGAKFQEPEWAMHDDGAQMPSYSDLPDMLDPSTRADIRRRITGKKRPKASAAWKRRKEKNKLAAKKERAAKRKKEKKDKHAQKAPAEKDGGASSPGKAKRPKKKEAEEQPAEEQESASSSSRPGKAKRPKKKEAEEALAEEDEGPLSSKKPGRAKAPKKEKEAPEAPPEEDEGPSSSKRPGKAKGAKKEEAPEAPTEEQEGASSSSSRPGKAKGARKKEAEEAPTEEGEGLLLPVAGSGKRVKSKKNQAPKSPKQPEAPAEEGEDPSSLKGKRLRRMAGFVNDEALGVPPVGEDDNPPSSKRPARAKSSKKKEAEEALVEEERRGRIEQEHEEAARKRLRGKTKV